MPQGSVLCRILFNMYVKDISHFIKNSTVIQYADDTQFILSGTKDNVQELVRNCEETLKRVKLYFHTNGLMLNTGKTQCMFVGTRGNLAHIPNNTVIHVDGSIITPNTSIKNLGIYFDNNMLFDTHASYISKKCFGTIMLLNRLKENFDKDTRIILIQSLVLSIINYGLMVWGNTAASHIHQVQKTQNFAAKVALGGNKFDHVTPYLRELKWLKICDMYKYELGIIMFDIMIHKLPGWLFSCPRLSK